MSGRAALGRGHRPGPHPARERGQPPRRAATSSPSPTAWAATRPARWPARSPSTSCGARLGDAAASTSTHVVAAVAEANGDIFPRRHRQPRPAGHGHHAHRSVRRHRGDRRTATTSPTDRPTPRRDSSFALVNVGDSRTYLLRHGRLRRVTIDHSYVQELVATGHITDDEARTHPRRNIVTRALGIDPTVRVDAWTLPLVRGDRFVLCSDGLVDEVARQPRSRRSLLDDHRSAGAPPTSWSPLANRQRRARQHHRGRRRRARRRRPAGARRASSTSSRCGSATTPARRGPSTTPRRSPTAFDDLAALANAQGVKLATPPLEPARRHRPDRRAVGQPRRAPRRWSASSSRVGGHRRHRRRRSSSPPPTPGAATTSPSTTTVRWSSTRARRAASCGSSRRAQGTWLYVREQLDDPIDRAGRRSAPAFDSERRRRVRRRPAATTTTTTTDHHDHDDDHHRRRPPRRCRAPPRRPTGAAGRPRRRTATSARDDHDAVASGVMATTSPIARARRAPSCRWS